MTNISGFYYRTHFAYCHPYMEKYPEGVAISAKYELTNKHSIDLNKGLKNGIRPLMDRFAAIGEAQIYKKRIIFASLHLDHDENQEVRLAQAEKLLSEIERLYGTDDSYYCCILSGDFNDIEDSLCLNYLKEQGFKDTYRICHPTGGNTFTTANPFTRIDYIMVKGDVKRIHHAELILNNPQYSDHIGLYAVIE
ncbi:metallophosphoesterase [Candidatus Magnetoovum chiemensis]|nr:metallophosphoesterase [Candidatus Magnetoovum chiemensis]